MKITSFCALCAAFAVPALVQSAFADEEVSYVEQLFVEVIEAQTEFLTITDNVMKEDLSPDVAAVAIDKLCKKLTVTLTKIGALSDADAEAFVEIMADEEVAKGVLQIDEGCVVMLQTFAENDYFGNAALKAACEAYAELNDYEL